MTQPYRYLTSVFTLVISLFLFLSPFGHANVPTDTVSFAHLTDVHYDAAGIDTSRRLLKDSPALLKAALKTLNQHTHLDFLLFTGDSVNTPRQANFKGFFHTLNQWNKLPYYLVLGNHDVGVQPAQTRQDTIDAFRSLGCTQAFPAKSKGWYSVSPKPWLKLIVLDGTTDTKVSANGFVPQAELSWLKQELQTAIKANQMVILSSHFPLVEPFHSKSHHIVQPDASKLQTLIDETPNVVAYFAGHYHSARIQKRNNVYYITSPALVEYPNAYRLVTINKNGTISLSWKTPRPDLAKKSKQRSRYAQTANGNPSRDHTLTQGTLRFHL